MSKKFIISCVFFIVLLYIGQLVIFYFYPYRPPINIDDFKKQNINIIYFGDSTLSYISEKDTDKRSTPMILNEVLGGKYTVGTLANPSWNSTIFAAYGKYMQEQQFSPKYVIVPINLRSFSVEWDLRPTFQFNEDLNYFRYYNTPLLPFLNFINNFSHTDVNQKYENLYKNTLVYDGNTPIGKAEIFENMSDTIPYETRFRNIITFFYFSAIHPNHRKLQSLVDIADLYKATDTRVTYYIVPVDYQTGEKYFGGKFKDRISHNVDVITTELEKKGATVIDLSFSLETKDFTWHEDHGYYRYINEHINNRGKYYVSYQLAKIIDPNLNEK